MASGSSFSPKPPVELLEAILDIAEEEIAPLGPRKHARVTPAFSIDADPCSKNRMFPQYHKHADMRLFALRRSFVLVCKAWYHAGIARLWSHVRLTLYEDNRRISQFRQTIHDKPTLASCVRCITLRHDPRDYYRRITKPMQDIEETMAILPNISLICFPGSSKGPIWVEPDPTILIRLESGWNDIEPFVGDPSWNYLTALCFKLDGTPLPNIQTIVSLPTLVCLRLQASDPSSASWVTDRWNLPALRSLSIIASDTAPWLPLIRKYRTLLEEVEVMCQYASSPLAPINPPPQIELPRLRALTLSDTKHGGSQLNSPMSYLGIFCASSLQRLFLVFHKSPTEDPAPEVVLDALRKYVGMRLLTVRFLDTPGLYLSDWTDWNTLKPFPWHDHEGISERGLAIEGQWYTDSMTSYQRTVYRR